LPGSVTMLAEPSKTDSPSDVMVIANIDDII
jgi:hypothetical protein